MTVDSKRIQTVFLAAVEAGDPAARVAVLDRECGADAELRLRVEALLKAHDAPASLLDGPALEAAIAAGPQDGHDPRTTFAEQPGAERDEPALDFLQSSARPDSLGRLGHYDVLQVLGKGGFGIVFRAFDEALQRIVAIKVLSPQMAAASPARKRFLREARSSAKVRHENIVQVYAVEEEPLPYLVMEFIPGETLQQRLDRTGPLEVTEVVHIGRQIAEGLEAAHGAGLIHRDVKPANILIEAGPHEHVKITDFGLARAADDASLTQSGMVAGTPMFMAPEQAQGERLDHRADLFSLGSVLYTMCSGRPPFRANNTLAVLKRVAEDTPRPIPEIIPETPLWLCTMISRLHAKKPEDRLATAQEVADLLARGLAQMQRPGNVPNVERNSARSSSSNGLNSVPRAQPMRPRFRTGRWAAAAAVLLLLLGGLGITEATGVTKVRGTVVRLFSPEGTLVVEVDDPGVSIRIDGSEMVITGAGAKEIRLKPGSYTVEARKDGKLVRRELVAVTNNGRQVVRVSQEALPPPPPPTSLDPDRRAAEYVLSIGGSVTVQVNEQDRNINKATELPREPFRLTAFGLQSNKQVSDAGLANCAGCKNLTHLCLGHMPVSDAGVANFKECKNLKVLQLFGTQVSDAGLANFAGCKNLTSLWLAHTRQVHGAGLAHLKNLTHVWLNESGVTDAGLAHLKDCKNLTFLTLDLTQVSDAGLAHLADCKNLTVLEVGRTQVSDAGLAHLKEWKKLTDLRLDGTQVGDAGLVHLKECKNLTKLNVKGTKVTAKGIDDLKKALPMCKIDTSDP